MSKYLVYHLVSPQGHPVDLWTDGNKKGATIKFLLEGHDNRVSKIQSYGWQVQSIGSSPKPSLESTTGGQGSFCEEHKVEMKPRQGKYGLFYSHSKQVDGDWIYCSGKGWGK